MGVSFSAEFFFAAAALISFGTVVMCSLSLVRRQENACLPGCGWCCMRARPRQWAQLGLRPSFYRFRRAGRRIACGCEKAARMEVARRRCVLVTGKVELASIKRSADSVCRRAVTLRYNCQLRRGDERGWSHAIAILLFNGQITRKSTIRQPSFPDRKRIRVILVERLRHA